MKRPVFAGHAGCAAIAQALGEAGVGRAGMTRGWLLIEQPGGWPKDPFAGGGLDAGVLATLADRARGRGLRILAIRRPLGRDLPASPQRTVYLAHSGPGHAWMERRVIHNYRELLDLHIASLASTRPPGWGQREDDALYLVCTHAAKDACCGIRGRPLARSLAALRGDQVWECSHVGGDRFAANLVCLPEGLYYGHVDSPTGARIIEAHEGGELVLDHLRGRSCHAPMAQAAEHLLRYQLGLHGIDDLAPVEVSARGDGQTRVVLEGTAGRYVVDVSTTTTGRARPTGCGATPLCDPGCYQLGGVSRQGETNSMPAPSAR